MYNCIWIHYENVDESLYIVVIDEIRKSVVRLTQ